MSRLQVFIPVPSDADSPRFKSSVGSVKYAPEKRAFVWTIRSFPGGREVRAGCRRAAATRPKFQYFMRAHFSLPSIEGEEIDKRIPVRVHFEIPYFTTSGLQASRSLSAQLLHRTALSAGSLPQDHREKRLSGAAVGSIRDAKRRLSNSNGVDFFLSNFTLFVPNPLSSLRCTRAPQSEFSSLSPPPLPKLSLRIDTYRPTVFFSSNKSINIIVILIKIVNKCLL